MMSAARRRRYIPVVLALWPILGGLSTPRALASAPGGLTDLFAPPPSELVVPALPTPSLPAGDPTPRQAEVTFVPFNSWGSLQRGDRERRKVENKAELEGLGQLTSEVIMRLPERTPDTPFERGEWSREDTVQLPVAGPLSLFGQTAMNGEYAADQNMTVVGRTGAILKLPVGTDSPLELRGGPAIKYNDAMRPDRTRDQRSLLLEVQAKWPIVAGIGLEYSGAALPPMTTLDHTKLDQSLGLAIPLSGGKLKFGAKHHWEQLQGAAPGTTNMELFVGVEIGR